MTKKGLPIGTQTFSTIRENNGLYIDKTSFIAQLIENPNDKNFFLSRPRRFGKSLFLSTLKSAFKGEKQYFKDLYLEKNWNWEKKHPVLHISFGRGVARSREELQQKFTDILRDNTEEGIILESLSLGEKYYELVKKLAKKYGKKVVILVDEYDKPILDNILKPEIALEIRDELKNIYSVIKDADEFVQFAFITGVSKFSKVNLFSGLNNLKDLSLNPKYGEICGFTEQEITDNFQDYLEGIDREKMKKWYNGYNFLGKNTVYNPFGTLLFLDSREYKNYWFESGSPSFLIQLIQEKKYNIPDLENMTAREKILESFDIENLAIETLLFQSGYLTIKEKYSIGGATEYLLKYPNTEVKMSLADSISEVLKKNTLQQSREMSAVFRALASKNLDDLKDIFHSFFASIPHDWYRKNDISNYEGYYASIVYCYFTALGLDTTAEDSTNAGKIDMTIFLPGKWANDGKDTVFVLEFKVKEYTQDQKNTALQQIKERKYHEKFLRPVRRNTVHCVSTEPGVQDGSPDIFLIGAEFSKDEKNITQFEWEKVS
jgi:hypothetical protein